VSHAGQSTPAPVRSGPPEWRVRRMRRLYGTYLLCSPQRSKTTSWLYAADACITLCRPASACMAPASQHLWVSTPQGHAVIYLLAAAPSDLASQRGRDLTADAATGDIDDMWLRDSSVQMAIYLPRIEQHPALRRIIEGAIRLQAYYISQVTVQATFLRPLRHQRSPVAFQCAKCCSGSERSLPHLCRIPMPTLSNHDGAQWRTGGTKRTESLAEPGG